MEKNGAEMDWRLPHEEWEKFEVPRMQVDYEDVTSMGEKIPVEVFELARDLHRSGHSEEAMNLLDNWLEENGALED